MSVSQYLITGRNQPFLVDEIRRALTQASHIEIAVSFIRNSGLSLIIEDIEDAITSEERDVSLTILTSDYMNITEPQALKRLMLLKERGADIRVYQSAQQTSFHLKAYLLIQQNNDTLEQASAFIGSSNISKTALTDGIEWNYKISFPDEHDSYAVHRIEHIRSELHHLLTLQNVIPLSYDWIQSYEKRYIQAKIVTPMHTPPIPEEEEYEAPSPLPHQAAALDALSSSRANGEKKGLVVLATGMGKTYLAAFDAKAVDAKKVLFVAHREEILLQAEKSFLAINPDAKVGRYNGKTKTEKYNFLFASVQTIGQQFHLNQFAQNEFDYIVVDEFHHAAANVYIRLLNHFSASYLLGLTATPNRTDGSDILKLCDNNLVYEQNLFDGVTSQILSPFSYYGIYDDTIDYDHIPWRSGRFDPEKLSNKLATDMRANHAYREWQKRAQQCTLAFCVSTKHADFMAAYFHRKGVKAASIHSNSELTRSEALANLESGKLEILFSVDLFNEGVDVPIIDTVLMLRPTESKILFLQQLGRGLRKHKNKPQLVVLDFVGNHYSFLNRPEILLSKFLKNPRDRKELNKVAKHPERLLPDGCFVNFDLGFIDFMESLTDDEAIIKYKKLRSRFNRRPTFTEFWNSGASLDKLRRNHGSWWEFVDQQDDITPDELEVLEEYGQWFKDLEVTKTSKSYKLVLLDTLLNNNALHVQNDHQQLAIWSKQWFLDHPEWISDLPESKQDLSKVADKEWLQHWRTNPIKFWGTEEKRSNISWFNNKNKRFVFEQTITAQNLPTLLSMTREINALRLAKYQQSNLTGVTSTQPQDNTIPFFPNIAVACGHFKTGSANVAEPIVLPRKFNQVSLSKAFIAKASGDSMSGGSNPIYDGEYLLFEQLGPHSQLKNEMVALEQQNQTGDNQYLLRQCVEQTDGTTTLKATNRQYDDLVLNPKMKPFAKLAGKVEPLELLVGHELMREDIPPLFGEEFNPGNWQSGHIVLNDKNVQILLVTANKNGRQKDQRFDDYFIDELHFHWQSQNSTSLDSKRGQQIINHVKNKSRVYLFVRQHKLRGKKASPFVFHGEVKYISHEGEKPMIVIWELI